jgi:hypothetical protein
MRYYILFLVGCVISTTACGRVSRLERSSDTDGIQRESSQAKTSDVESVLRRGKWQSRSGLSNGVAWQFADGGRVLIHDGGEIDESHQWKVISRNESERKIRIKFWNPDEVEHREWEFAFGAEGSPAKVNSFVYKGSQITDSDAYLRYPVD